MLLVQPEGSPALRLCFPPGAHRKAEPRRKHLPPHLSSAPGSKTRQVPPPRPGSGQASPRGGGAGRGEGPLSCAVWTGSLLQVRSDLLWEERRRQLMSVSIRGLKRARTRLHGCRSPNYGGGPARRRAADPGRGGSHAVLRTGRAPAWSCVRSHTGGPGGPGAVVPSTSKEARRREGPHHIRKFWGCPLTHRWECLGHQFPCPGTLS